LVPVVQQAFIRMKTTLELMSMLIVGQVSSKEEASEITFIAKLFVVGQRARFLALNKNADFDDENDVEDEEEEENN
jgi:hypothetical protein